MKRVRLIVILLALMPSFAPAQVDDEFGMDNTLPGLQTNVVRAQLAPLKKAVFSAGIAAIVQSVSVQEGEAVKAGQTLLNFDCDRIQASRSVAQARINSASATLKVNEELLRLNSVGPLEVELNRAELQVAKGELAAVRSQLKYCQLKAPFDGAITMRVVEPHQFVAEGETMLELVSKDSLEVRMLMPSTSLAWLREGASFSMLVEELNVAMPGKIVRIGGAVDPVSLTINVFGRLLEDDEGLLPGMSGQVEFTGVEFE